MSGKSSYFKGIAAEEMVASVYRQNGFEVIEKRWKTREGEIDLVARHANKYYFVEVKSSSSFERAAERITPRQQQRIQNAALEYLAERARTVDVDCRFDAAIVDASGSVKVIPGAFLAHR
ncbi:MAG: YraN family protein [Rhodobacteraceae bacterium]|nr:YraN family protein [Paracoccaceae bacterium]